MSIDLREIEQFEVYFGHVMNLNDIPLGAILISPYFDRWNDFGHKVRCKFICKSKKGAVIESDAMLGFINRDFNPKDYVEFSRGINGETDSSGLDFILELLGKKGIVKAESNILFFTMLNDMNSYRDLVRLAGKEDAISILYSVRDMVATKFLNFDAPWFAEAVETFIFNYAFLRSSDAYFAYRNANSILRGLEREELGNISSSLRLNFRLSGFHNDHQFNFDFDHRADVPKRISVIIGENGIGKSQTLGRIAKSILNDTNDLRQSSDNGRPEVSRLLAFAPTNESLSIFPRDFNESHRITYRRFSLNRSRVGRRKISFADMIIDLARSEQQIKNTKRWDIFLDAIKSLRNSEQLVLEGVDPHVPFVRIIDLLKGSEKQRLDKIRVIDRTKPPKRLIGSVLYPLSSGEFSFFTFSAQVSLNIENGTLILLDEPETHLHPQFISQFVGLLDRLLELTGSCAIIATHSVYFVREVFREQVNVLRNTSGVIQVEKPRLRTFGADVGAISFFVFGETTPSLLANGVLTKLRQSRASWEALEKELSSELSSEMLMKLREMFVIHE
jgi:ABC-type Mn2+/Zn2+ transport system ATPase subunit